MLEPLWVGAPHFRKVSGRQLMGADQTPPLEDRQAGLWVLHATSATINIRNKHVIAFDELDELWHGPSQTVPWPFKSDVATVLKTQISKLDKTSQPLAFNAPALIKFLLVFCAVATTADVLPNGPHSAG